DSAPTQSATSQHHRIQPSARHWQRHYERTSRRFLGHCRCRFRHVSLRVSTDQVISAVWAQRIFLACVNLLSLRRELKVDQPPTFFKTFTKPFLRFKISSFLTTRNTSDAVHYFWEIAALNLCSWAGS